MTHCAKCGAELIGTRKFCTACGTPAGDPRSPAASTGMSPVSPGSAPGSSGPSIQYASAGPVSQVNPFAQTAGPATKNPAAADYGPPPSVPLELASTTPGVGDPNKAPQVSPLAISNVDSRRGAFVDAIVASTQSPSAESIRGPDSTPSGIKRGVPGTQIMPSMANPSAGPNASPGGAGQPSGPARERTQLLGVFPGVPASGAGSPPAPRVAPGSSGAAAVSSAYGPAPAPVAGHPPQTAPMQPALGVPPSHNASTPSHAGSAPSHGVPAHLASSPSHAAPAPAPQHMGPGVPLPSPHQGWNPAPYAAAAPVSAYVPPMPPAPAPAPPPPPGYGYGFGYAPGSRVTVTWSNGQRYPGTVTQVTGNQCLVVFPDGQHHWVDLQYVAPG